MLCGMERHETYSYDEVRAWPAVVDLVKAAAVFQVGRTAAYELAEAGRFPVPVFKVGRRWRVSTQAILAKLDAVKEAS